MSVEPHGLCETQVLQQVHEQFFAARDSQGEAPEPVAADVRPILAVARSRVLAGVRIVFTAVYPLGSASGREYWWRVAERVRQALYSFQKNTVSPLWIF